VAGRPYNPAMRLLLLCLAALAGALAAPLAAEAATPPRYEIVADLDVARARLDVTQRTTYVNETGQPLPNLVFAVTSASFRAFTLRSASVAGQPASTSADGTILDVRLPAPLAPGASAAVELAYTVQVPTPGTNRFGSAGGIIALGNWYPVLFPFRDGGWLTHQYTPIGDAFVTEAADYDVTLRPSTKVVAAFTGQAVSRDGNNLRAAARGVRDFALALSARYETATATVDGVTITAYFLPEHRAGAGEYLRSGAEMLGWLNARLGRYPWRTLDIAETWSDDPNGVGQEYPGVIFIASGVTRAGGGMGSYLSYLVAHEVAHEWFYGVVGDDQVREPWLDEAFATYLPERFYAERYPAIFADRWARFRARLADETARLGARPIDGGVDDYRDEGVYFAVVYRRGAAFLDELRETLGDAAFWRLLSGFVARNDGQIARGSDFLASAQAATERDLSPLFQRYFRRTAVGRGADWGLVNGHFFTQASGGQAGRGYRVTDDEAARLWTEFRRLGGVGGLGYPASRRFSWDGFTVQVFQKAILQWRPELGRAVFVNVLDRLSAAGKDDFLLAERMTPRPLDPSADTGLAWPAVVARHQAMLDQDPAIRAAYFADPDPILRYGLPVGYGDMGSAFVIRCQRAVFQRWKEDVPWAKAGQVTIANGGDLAKEAAILPADALAPESAP
jgi:hypothetical protein